MRESGEDRPSFKIEALAQGGEHLVFTYPDHPKLVGKVPVRVFETYVNEPDLAPAEAVARIERYLQDLRWQRTELCEYFGAQSLLPEHYQAVPVPITRALVAELLHMHVDDVPEHVVDGDTWMVPVRVQWRLKPEDGDVDCTFTYLESVTSADTRAFLLADPLALAVDQSLAEMFLEAYTDIPWRALNDEQKDVLRTFVNRCGAYTHHTGKILDLAGGANVLFHSTRQPPRIFLVDPLAGNESLFHEFMVSCESSGDIDEWNAHELNIVANIGGYFRLLAALSAVLEVPFPFAQDLRGLQLDWDRILQCSRRAFRAPSP